MGNKNRNNEEVQVGSYQIAGSLGDQPGLDAIRNPSFDFENDADGDSPPTGWLSLAAGSGEVDTAQKWDGSASVLVVGTDPANSGVGQVIDVKAGQFVRMIAYCKLSAATPNHGAIAIDTLSGVAIAYQSGSTNWERIEVIQEQTVDDVLASIYVKKATAANTDCWFDHVVVLVTDYDPRLACPPICKSSNEMDEGTCSRAYIGTHQVIEMDATGKYCGVEFVVPSGFKTLISAVLEYIAIGNQGATDGIDVDSEWGLVGGDYDDNSDSANGLDVGAVTDKKIYAVDVSSALDNLVAGDRVGMVFTVAAGSSPGDRGIIGFKLDWSY